MTTVIFACVHNAGRSQMAAAFFNALTEPRSARALSAGTQPAARVHAEVVAVMREAGINLANATPTLLTDALARTAQVLVTMGCGEACPLIPTLLFATTSASARLRPRLRPSFPWVRPSQCCSRYSTHPNPD